MQPHYKLSPPPPLMNHKLHNIPPQVQRMKDQCRWLHEGLNTVYAPTPFVVGPATYGNRKNPLPVYDKRK